jgi:hypothetical protein
LSALENGDVISRGCSLKYKEGLVPSKREGMLLPRQCIPFYLRTPSDHNSALALVIGEIGVEAETRVSINVRRRFWAGNPEVRVEKPTIRTNLSGTGIRLLPG